MNSTSGGLTFICQLLIVAALLGASFEVQSQSEEQQGQDQTVEQYMNNDRLDGMINQIDPQATGKLGYWQFNVEDLTVLVITDEKSDRMRIITPVTDASELDLEQLLRMMQANFDSTLDARYSIAKGIVWSAFIHPLGSLTDGDFLSGVGQVVNIAKTFGTSYSSGLLMFRGGDSQELQQRMLIDELIDKGTPI
ncbi:MAG: type III secretion system chaperone [Gammaproteobacteria bacterium]|nr:type III secretion system chaperone [Gammaproteobacteria bacterium]